ncbi:hypothetical protein SESBI_15829 [Sesbania bispinosa]|nr:hypothetical protein SESBI_15829 [Sesbania bispinosa]
MATAAAELPHAGEHATVRDGPRGGVARHCSGRAQVEGVTAALGRKMVVGQRLFVPRARRGCTAAAEVKGFPFSSSLLFLLYVFSPPFHCLWTGYGREGCII